MEPTRSNPPAPWLFGRVYYGWVIVVVMALVGAAQFSGFNTTAGAFIKPMAAEFGWSRSAFVGAITIGTFLGGLVALVLGPALDRFGPRWFLFTAFLVLGAVFVAMGQVSHLWNFYILMVFSRLLVSGGIGIATTVTVSKWFVRKRGRAVGLTNVGHRLGGGLVPLFVQTIIGIRGWRTATVSLGLLIWGLTLLPVGLLLRRQPEDLGLQPDGDLRSRRGSEKDQATELGPTTETSLEVSFTLAEALRTRAFYVIMAAISGGLFVHSGFGLHALAYFSDQGLSPNLAVALVTTWSFLSASSSLFAGFLAERIAVKYLMAGHFFGSALAMLFLAQVTSAATGSLFAVAHGLALGAGFTAHSLIFPSYFGRSHLGAIRGFTAPFQMAAAALGPQAIALVFDSTGSYSVVPFVFTAILALCGVAMLMVPAPRGLGASMRVSN